MDNAGDELPNEREVAYFVHLHLDTVTEQARHSEMEDVWIYSVQGKPRPMLVLRRLPERKRGRRMLLVVPITSQGLDSQRKLLPDHEPIGDCLDRGKPSYLKLQLQRLPENLVHRQAGKSSIKQPCDPFAFGHVIKTIENKIRLGELQKLCRRP